MFPTVSLVLLPPLSNCQMSLSKFVHEQNLWPLSGILYCTGLSSTYSFVAPSCCLVESVVLISVLLSSPSEKEETDGMANFYFIGLREFLIYKTLF